MSIISPFKFLDSFEEKDKESFFGRETEEKDLISQIYESNLIIVYGPTGSGKTSLVNCSLPKHIKKTDYLAINIRRKDNLIKSLKTELLKTLKLDSFENFTLSKAVEMIYHLYYSPVFMIFDQFEELFIFGKDDEKKEFVDFLIEILQMKYSYKIIILIREDYYAHLTEFEDKVSTIFSNKYRVEKISKNKVYEVITKSCDYFNIKYEKNSEKKILENIIPDNKFRNFELTDLQVYLDKLHENSINNVTNEVIFNDENIQKTGVINDVLERFLDEQIQKFPENNLRIDLAWKILGKFTSMEGTKKQVTYSKIHEELQKDKLANLDEIQLKKYLTEFEKLRIIRMLEE